jgi:predicted nucleic acid-binding protein
MTILDTSVWIEFFKKKPEIFTPVKKLLEAEEVYALECIFGELLQGAKNNQERDLIIAYWRHLPKIDVNGIWIDAGKYSGENKLSSQGVGLIDAVIIMAAIRSKSKVWTLDQKLIKILNKKIIFVLETGLSDPP